jgi:hypothetical protein
MVISQILGGLGNQMFQYAAARALALSRAQPLLLDLAEFDSYKLHNGFELDRVFVIDSAAAKTGDLLPVLGWRTPALVRKVLKRRLFAPLRGAHLAIEPAPNYWPRLQTIESPLYMMGYWQSERYFLMQENTIRTDFCFRRALEGRDAALAAEMADTPSVSVHLRRGDYLSDQVMDICSLDYYRSAAKHMEERIGHPTYYVFSDDADWVRRHVDFLPGATFIDHNKGPESYKDMHLMSRCKHHIIANSSFSWWGAWLNPSVEKIVVAPRTWFRDGRDDTDHVPSHWTRL